jgi:DNA-binding LytR/AlgR family response regulator
MKIKCLIIDDEPAAQEILKTYTADDSRLELVEVCSNAFKASDVLAKEKIDLLFLDINMPKLSGLAFYKTLNQPPAVIFTTAYPEFAVEGFEVDAVDYLLKPFTFERFYKAVSKVFEKMQAPNAESKDFIVLNANKKMYKINIADIFYLEAQADYVNVHLKDKELLVHETLQHLHQQLPENQFMRIHKSFVVSLNKFDYIEGNMLMINSKYLPIGEAYREKFLKTVKK